MNWFLAKLVFRVSCGAGNHPPQFEEQLRLVTADDELHAFHKARLLGEADCLAGEGNEPMPVKWTFIDVTELHLLTRTADGAEIQSVLREDTNGDLYIRNVKKMATQLLQRSLHQFTAVNNLLVGT